MASLLSWRKSFSGLMLVLFYIAATSNGYIVDLTLVTNHPLLDPPNTRDQYIGAYLGQKDASIRDNITFDRIIWTADTHVLPKYSNTVDEGQVIRKLNFEQSNQTKALGAFNATFEYDGITRLASTVVLMHNATVLPERTTFTVHAGETVTIAVVTNMTEGSLRWRFNGDKLPANSGKQSLTLENVQLNHTGVYKCFVAGKRWEAENAIFLLHVIRCQAYRWGSECEHTCTECLNGGKCDADSGECVCPPGFNGTTCEHVLGSNRFGQDGSFSCDSSGDDHSPGCRGKLFCLPDPFGCTCAAGFMGINCTTECNPGKYGAHCLQECHCSPRNICTKDTGECIDGTACLEGWTGVNCQVRSSPIQDVDGDTRPASVGALQMSTSTTQIEVSWEPSTSPCSPDFYIIRYSLYQKLACQSPETTQREVEVNTNVTQYNNLVGLEPYSRYQITVTAVNGAGQSEPTIGYSDTRPGQPSNITHVRVNPERTSPTRLGFTWQPLNCGNVNGVFWYYYPRIYKDGDKINAPAGITYLDDDMSFSSVEFNGLEACTMYELSIHAVNRDVVTPGNVSHAIGVTGVTITNASAYATGNQIRVYWSVPSQCNVDYYRLSYQLISRKACQDVPIIDAPVYELNVISVSTDVSKYLSNLEYYATYSISIIAVIRKEESLPMNVSGDTRDGDPSAIDSVSYTSTAHSLRFVWEEPSCESLHGALYGYEYDLYDPTGGGRYVRYLTTIRRNYVPIPGLDACTEYRFRIRVVTTPLRRSEWHMEMAMTNISAPGMPVITELTQHQEDSGTTGLTVSWQPPFSPPCQPTHYEIKYSVLQGDMCEDTPRDRIMTSAGTVNGSTFTFDVLELRPNSEYMVFVRGRTSSSYGDSDSQVATTGYSHPTGPPTNIQSTSTKKRSIVFTWEKPECGSRNGPISSYEVMLSNYTGDVVYHGNVSGPEREIFDLIPYSNYSIRIRAWNYELAGEYGPAIWAQTDEAKPAPPIGVKLPSSDQESITVEWMSPNPPLGRIIGYYIIYWETFSNSSTPRNVSISCQDGRCSDINYRLSAVILELQADTNYSVQVMAETIHGVSDSSPDPPVVRITSEGIPSEPQEVAVSSRSKSLLITWKEPRYPRGRIISYTLTYKVKGKPYDRSFQPEDSFTMNELAGASSSFVLDDLEPATLYEVYVVASTSKGEGESSQHVEEFTEPPAADELPKPNPPVIVSSPDGTPTIQFSDALESPYITHILVAVEERLPVTRRRRQQAAYGSYAENPSSYIAASISKDDLPIELTIGDNETYGIYHNAPLRDKAIYDIRTGVESNVGGKKSTLFGDPSEVQTAGVPSGSIATVVGSAVGAICVIVIVIILIIIFYKRRSNESAPTKV